MYWQSALACLFACRHVSSQHWCCSNYQKLQHPTNYIWSFNGQSESCTINGSTGKMTTDTPYTPIPHTKTTETESIPLLHNRIQGIMTTTTNQQHLASNLYYQNDVQSSSVRPCWHCIVRVIWNTHTNKQWFHSTSQPETITTTHSSPTIATNTGQDSEAQPKHPWCIVRIWCNKPPVHPKHHPSNPCPCANHSNMCTSAISSNSIASGGNMMCVTGRQHNDNQHIVKVCHQGELASPNIQQQQPGTTPTAQYPPSSESLRTAFASNMSPNIMAASRLHHTAPILPLWGSSGWATSVPDGG